MNAKNHSRFIRFLDLVESGAKAADAAKVAGLHPQQLKAIRKLAMQFKAALTTGLSIQDVLETCSRMGRASTPDSNPYEGPGQVDCLVDLISAGATVDDAAEIVGLTKIIAQCRAESPSYDQELVASIKKE